MLVRCQRRQERQKYTLRSVLGRRSPLRLKRARLILASSSVR